MQSYLILGLNFADFLENDLKMIKYFTKYGVWLLITYFWLSRSILLKISNFNKIVLKSTYFEMYIFSTIFVKKMD